MISLFYYSLHTQILRRIALEMFVLPIAWTFGSWVVIQFKKCLIASNCINLKLSLYLFAFLLPVNSHERLTPERAG